MGERNTSWDAKQRARRVEAGKPSGRYVLYTNGASRGNPGPAGIGAVLYRSDGEPSEVGRLSEAIGVETNNVAEYRAVIAGGEMALRHTTTRRRSCSEPTRPSS